MKFAVIACYSIALVTQTAWLYDVSLLLWENGGKRINAALDEEAQKKVTLTQDTSSVITVASKDETVTTPSPTGEGLLSSALSFIQRKLFCFRYFILN